MTPGPVGSRGWITLALWFLSFHLCAELNGQGPALIGHGLTNHPVGSARLYSQGYGYSVENLGSNGNDGVSITLGEPEGGVYFEPYVPELADGHFMSGSVYGTLNGTNDALLTRIWGGRANELVYPLNLDFSPLAPESVTYQIYAKGILQRELTRGQAMVVTRFGTYYRPLVNPLCRRLDNSLGASIILNDSASFVFPDALTSAYGDELFIRVNNPAHSPGVATRLEVLGGGMNNFWPQQVSLGMFGRPHRSSGGATLHAAPGSLRLGNLLNTNEAAGVIIEPEPVASLRLDFEPFQLNASNALVELRGMGGVATWGYEFLGVLTFTRQGDRVLIDRAGDFYEPQITVLSNGVVVHEEIARSAAVDGNVSIAALTAHAKTVENLPGYHIKFSQATSITVNSNGPAHVGNEVRFGLPGELRIEHLFNVSLVASNLDSITITNEAVTPVAGPPSLSIERSPDNGTVVLRWPDPNRVYLLQETYFYSPQAFYYTPANHTWEFNDPYVTAVAPLIKTNSVHFFRLWYSPDR